MSLLTNGELLVNLELVVATWAVRTHVPFIRVDEKSSQSYLKPACNSRKVALIYRVVF